MAASQGAEAGGEGAPTHGGGVVYRREGGETTWLLVKAKRSKQRVFPKGHIEKGESAEECAVREVFEESGVSARVVDELGRSSFEREGKPLRVLYFLMEAEEIEEAGEGFRKPKWYPLEGALERIPYPDLRGLLEDGARRLGGGEGA